jgi:hypothetical protein
MQFAVFMHGARIAQSGPWVNKNFTIVLRGFPWEDSTMPVYETPYGEVEATEEPSALAVELYGFLHGYKDSGVSKAQHFKAASKLIWNKNTKDFIWHPWAEDMLEEACQQHWLGLIGCASSGKCLAPSVKVLMFDGSVKDAKDITAGDLLMGDDSTPRTVLSTNIGKSEMVRIIPARGQPWECNDDHILCVKRMWAGEKSRRRVGMVDELSVKEYLAKSPTWRKQRGLYSVGVEFPSHPVEFDPQIYGIWLGDGGTGRPIIHSDDREVEVNEFIASYFTRMGFNVRKAYYDNGTCASYMITHGYNRGAGVENRFLNFVRESSFGSGGKKRILPRYLFNSREVRMRLLAGIIDSDGHAAGASVDGEIKRNPTYFEISCSEDELTQDIAFLARSLGFKVTLKNRMVRCNNGKLCPSWRINVMGDTQAIPTLRKKCFPKKLRMNSTCSGFDVQRIGVGDWCGFTLDGNGRFLLEDFTVTHNTDFAAVWAILNWLADIPNTKILVTSTSLKESRKRIWGSVCEYWGAAPGLPGKLVDSIGMIRSMLPGQKLSDKSGIELIPGEKKKEREAIGKLIGIKNKRMIFIADELPELSEALLTAAYSNLSMNPFFQFIGIGNFNSIFDPLGVFTKPVQGWGSITPETVRWETERGICLRFDGTQSPNLKLDKDIWPIYGRKQVEEHKKLKENSIEWWRMCRSFPCPSNADATIYSEADFIKSDSNRNVIWKGGCVRLAALDPGFTNNGDRSAARLGLLGIDAESGMTTLKLEKHEILVVDVTKRGRPRNFQIAEHFRDFCVDNGVSPDNASIDATGGGIAFCDIVDEVWSSRYLRVQFGGAPSDLRGYYADERTGKDAYVNRVTELWFNGLAYVLSKQIAGIDDETARELAARRYTTHKSGDYLKACVEAKPDMKLRISISPDLADSAMILLELARVRHGFMAAGVEKARVKAEDEWDRMVKEQQNLKPSYSAETTDDLPEPVWVELG